MAGITLNMSAGGIVGESAMTGHADELDATAIRDLVRAPDTAAKAYVSEIFVTRYRDKASPKLAEVCSLGVNVGTVTISIFKNTETGPQAFMQYELEETFVSRIEHETAEDNGGAYLPHQGYSGSGGTGDLASIHARGSTMNADRNYSRSRARPRPLFPMPIAASVTDAEVERLWLSAAKIKWTYTPFVGGVAEGAVEKGWNMLTSESL